MRGDDTARRKQPKASETSTQKFQCLRFLSKFALHVKSWYCWQQCKTKPSEVTWVDDSKAKKQALNISTTMARLLDVKALKNMRNTNLIFLYPFESTNVCKSTQDSSAKEINLFYSTFYILLCQYFTTMKMHWQAFRRGCLASLANPRWTWNIIQIEFRLFIWNLRKCITILLSLIAFF